MWGYHTVIFNTVFIRKETLRIATCVLNKHSYSPKCERMGKVDHEIIALIMKAVSVSETSINLYYITQDSHLHTRRNENFKTEFIIILAR